MFVRKDKDGNLVAVGSIDQSLLTQLQRESKKDSAKAESKTSSEPKPESESEPKPEPKPEPVVDKPKGAVKPHSTASKLP
jgi:hypothetical protein